MNRRDLIKSAVGAALAAALTPAEALLLPGGSPVAAAGVNPIWVNFDAGGGGWRSGGGLPIFKNRVRESRGFTLQSDNLTQVALNASGWPTTDFSCVLYDGAIFHAWCSGTFKCGFIGSGSETIGTYANCTISNIVHGTGGAYTTFDLTPSAGIFGFKVSGTSGAITDIFAYLPAYPGSAIDDTTSTASITNEAASFYSQFAGIRFMWFQDAADTSRLLTSANRNTVSNTQANKGWHNFSAQSFATAPGVGATSATLSAPWPFATGTYFLDWAAAGSVYYGRICSLTNGATTCTWDASRPLTSTDAPTGTGFGFGFEGYPIDWAITLCNAANCSIRIQTPWLEDGTNYSAGSWSSDVFNTFKTRWTSKGRVEFSPGNENFNPQYKTYYQLRELQALYSGTYADIWHYMAYRFNAFANLGRTTLGAAWGTTYFQVFEYQAVTPHSFWNTLSIYSTYGTIKSDLRQGDIAPYCNPTVGTSDSVATIESEATSAALTYCANNSTAWAESTAITLMHFGLPMGSYEGPSFQWNNGYSSVTNLGAAIMDTGGGYQAAVAQLYTTACNSGFDLSAGFRHFQEGVTSGVTSATSPQDSFTNSYTNRNSAPTLLALQQFMNGSAISITHNDVTTPGAVISGTKYAPNNSAFDSGSPILGNKNGPNPSNYAIGYLLYSKVARTVNLSANFTNSGGSAGSTQLEYGCAASGYSILGGTGTPTSVSIPTGTNDVSIGSFPVVAGWNYIVLGNPSVQQSSILINSLTAN